MTIDGPVNANQTHYELHMTVGADLSQLNLDQGYQGTVIKSDTYANNPSSYAEFLRALDIAGFSKGNTNQSADNDPRGVCATGDRNIYQIINNNGNDIENFWATTCGGQGTFEGQQQVVISLFIAQMPDFNSVVSNTDLLAN
jgi:hypothetical protein